MTTASTERLRALVDAAGVDPVDGFDLPPLSDQLLHSLELPDDPAAELSISDVAAATGVSAHTLRYYERIGLVEVPRNGSGRRAYDSHAIARVVFLTRLRMSDMPIRDISRYIELMRRGESTVPQRLTLLQAHRESVQQRLRDLQAALAVSDYKITTYGGLLAPRVD